MPLKDQLSAGLDEFYVNMQLIDSSFHFTYTIGLFVQSCTLFPEGKMCTKIWMFHLCKIISLNEMLWTQNDRKYYRQMMWSVVEIISLMNLFYEIKEEQEYFLKLWNFDLFRGSERLAFIIIVFLFPILKKKKYKKNADISID